MVDGRVRSLPPALARVSLENDADGNPIPVLDPWLWDTGVVYVFLALVVASLGFSFARYYAKWRLPLEIAGALVRIAPSVILIWLAANDHVINPAFIASVGWPETATRWIGPGPDDRRRHRHRLHHRRHRPPRTQPLTSLETEGPALSGRAFARARNPPCRRAVTTPMRLLLMAARQGHRRLRLTPPPEIVQLAIATAGEPTLRDDGVAAVGQAAGQVRAAGAPAAAR